MSNERFTLTIETEQNQTPAVARLRALLKRLKRQYAFRVVAIRPADRPEQPNAADAT